MYYEYSPPELAGLIDAIWFTDSSVDPAIGHLVRPTAHSELILKLYPFHSETVFSGPMTCQRRYPFIADAIYFGIRWSPASGTQFHSFSLGELRDNSIELRRAFACNFLLLAEQMHESSDRSEQLTLFANTITEKLARVDWDPNPDLLHALWFAKQVEGDITVADLAEHVGVSQRQLERLFRAHSGLTPKQYCRILRLQHLSTYLDEHPDTSLAQLALRCGYSDQAHMAREYKRMMGTTITERALNL